MARAPPRSSIGVASVGHYRRLRGRNPQRRSRSCRRWRTPPGHLGHRQAMAATTPVRALLLTYVHRCCTATRARSAVAVACLASTAAANVPATTAHMGKLLRASSGLAAASLRLHGLPCTSPAGFPPPLCLPWPGLTTDRCSSALCIEWREKGKNRKCFWDRNANCVTHINSAS